MRSLLQGFFLESCSFSVWSLESFGEAVPHSLIVTSLSAAGNAFCQAAKLHMQLQSKHDSATSFVDAGNAYKKADPQGEVTYLCLWPAASPVV